MYTQKQANNIYENVSYLLMFCILLLPLHTQVFYMVMPIYTHIPKEITSIWKEVLFIFIMTIFILNTLLSNQVIKIYFIDTVAITFLTFLVLLICISDDKQEAFYGFRVFTEPLIVFYLARNAKVSLETLNKLFVLIFCLGTVISAWGIFQASILGDKFLINLGYETISGKLNTSFYIAMFFFQRAVGTFASPNTFGIYLQMCIMLGFYVNGYGLIKNKKIYYLCNTIMLFALLYSFSRSSILSLILSFSIFAYFVYGSKKSTYIFLKCILTLIVVFSIFFIFNKDVVEPLITHTINTITLEDPSTLGHIDSLSNSVSFAMKNPLGVGLGKTGPRASARSGGGINSENSFFILLFDLGMFGLFLYLVLISLIMVHLYSKIKSKLNSEARLLYSVILSILIGHMAAWNLLPYIVELETTLILFFIIGLGYNNYIGVNEYA